MKLLLYFLAACASIGTLRSQCPPQTGAADGTLDTCFNAHLGYSFSPWLANSLAVQPDGKVVAVGNLYLPGAGAPKSILRFNPDGSADSTFREGAGFFADSGTELQMQSVLLQPDGKLLVAGVFHGYQGLRYPNLVRLHPDGSIDSAFASRTRYLNTTTLVRGLWPTGHILVSQSNLLSPNQPISYSLLRLNPDGSPDPIFRANAGGIQVRNSSLLPNGKVLAIEMLAPDQATLVCLEADGRRDAGFAFDTSFHLSTGGMNLTSQCFKALPDGNILVTGYFWRNGPAHLFRLHPDGSLDTTFHIGSGLGAVIGIPQINDMALQADGKVICGGIFPSYNGTAARSIFRLHPNGALDTTFHSGIGFTFNTSVGNVASLALTETGMLYAGGLFHFYDGTLRPGIVRLKAGPAIPQAVKPSYAGLLWAVPNPATTSFRLDGLTQPTPLRLIDALGRLVMLTSTSPNQPVNISRLSPGLYHWQAGAYTGRILVE